MNKQKAGVEIFCDGACRGNPGPGGWGAVLKCDGKTRQVNGFSANTTNNKMELTAAIESLKALKVSCKVVLYTDSSYVVKGMTSWIHNWKKNSWRTANKKPVKNAELWRELEKQTARHAVTFRWVKGHAGHPGNEKADSLANEAIDFAL